MNNSDKPASPVKPEVIQGNLHGQGRTEGGYTKREDIAISVMLSLCSNADYDTDRENIPRDAVSFADALLKELDK